MQLNELSKLNKYLDNVLNTLFVYKQFHQFFNYKITKITFVNPQRKNTNSKGDFVFKPGLKCLF